METNSVVLATGEEAVPMMDKLQDIGLTYGVKILGAVLVLIIGLFIAKMIVNSIGKLMTKRGVDDTLNKFCCSLLSVGLKALSLWQPWKNWMLKPLPSSRSSVRQV